MPLKPLKPLTYRTQSSRRPDFALVRTSTTDGGPSRTYVEVLVPVKGTDWTLHTLRPVGQTLNLARGLAGGITLLLGTAWPLLLAPLAMVAGLHKRFSFSARTVRSSSVSSVAWV